MLDSRSLRQNHGAMTVSREKISETLVAFCQPILDVLDARASLEAHEAAFQVGVDVWNAHVYETLGMDPEAGATLEAAESLAQGKQLGLGHARGLKLVELLQRIKREQAPKDLRRMGDPRLSPSGNGWNLKVQELATASAEDLQPIGDDPELAMVRAWERLTRAAKAVARLQPWNWLDETQSFGVLHPVRVELDWASISHGAPGPTFELRLGTERGSTRANKLGSEGQFDRQLHDEVLSAQFVDREQLDAKDAEFLRSMGYELDAPAKWPILRVRFRDESDADLTFEEVVAFAIALEQLHVVASRALVEPDYLRPDAQGRLLLRFPTRRTGEITWRDERVQPTQPALLQPAPFDRDQAARVRARVPSQRGKLECDLFELPAEVDTPMGRRKSVVGLFVDGDSGEVVHSVTGLSAEGLAMLPGALLAAIELRKSRPNFVYVRDPAVAAALEPAITSLGIRLKLVGLLPNAERAIQAIEGASDDDSEGS